MNTKKSSIQLTLRHLLNELDWKAIAQLIVGVLVNTNNGCGHPRPDLSFFQTPIRFRRNLFTNGFLCYL